MHAREQSAVLAPADLIKNSMRSFGYAGSSGRTITCQSWSGNLENMGILIANLGSLVVAQIGAYSTNDGSELQALCDSG